MSAQLYPSDGEVTKVKNKQTIEKCRLLSRKICNFLFAFSVDGQREIESNECTLQHASAAGALPRCNISTSVQRELPFYSNIQGTSLRIRTPYYMEEGLRISLIYTHFCLFLLNIWGTTYLHNMAGFKPTQSKDTTFTKSRCTSDHSALRAYCGRSLAQS